MGVSFRSIFSVLLLTKVSFAGALQVGQGYFVLEDQAVILSSPNGREQFTAPPGAKLTVVDIQKTQEKKVL